MYSTAPVFDALQLYAADAALYEPPLGQEDGVDAGTFRRADDGPHIVDVFDAVEEDQERYLPLFISSDEDVCQIGVFHGLGKGDDALVAVARCQVVEDLQGHVFAEDFLPACQVAATHCRQRRTAW